MFERNHLLNEIISLNIDKEIDFRNRMNHDTPQDVASTGIARFPVVPANSRRIFVTDNKLFQSLPQVVRDAAIEELTRLFKFIGAVKGAKSMTVLLLEPSKFPEQFSCSDAVITLVSSPGVFKPYTRDALVMQGQNAAFSLGNLKAAVTYTNPFSASGYTPSDIDILGKALLAKRKFKNGKRVFVLPFMVSVISLNEAMDEYFQYVDSTIDQANALKRLATKDPDYLRSDKGREEAAKISVLDNPNDFSKWTWDLKPFGIILGRIMAHEIRHLYIGSAHAVDGLGRDSTGNLLGKNSSDFSSADKKKILKFIHGWEKYQGKAQVVPTFPAGKRVNFPF